MKITRERILNEILSSSEVCNIFHKCTLDLQEVLLKLVIESSEYSCNEEKYVKNMKETSIRFQKPYLVGRRRKNYCMLTFQPQFNRILVEVRTDGIFIDSQTIELNNIGNKYNGGFEWYGFSINKQDEIEEAVRLISKCYEG
ncbi:hypothetical protein [Clostridium butyricum]|uniref:hypothetical protein n=1 Tax=Clostridium butyricum TaxID=1492 RepID=UPI0022E560C6|nr:hypothetical protein [Clostridium butyricum]